jgi:molybdenum cofactor biosynthesis enzyme MoaA
VAVQLPSSADSGTTADALNNLSSIYSHQAPFCNHCQPASLTLQANRISQLEAERAQLLTQLPPEVQTHVVKRQQEAVEEEGGLHTKGVPNLTRTAFLGHQALDGAWLGM